MGLGDSLLVAGAAALLGFLFGLVGTLMTIRAQRSWTKRDTDSYNRKIVHSLIAEIEEGIVRAKYMAELAHQNAASFSRIYIALWQSTNQQLAATLDDAHVLTLLHRIYYRFDLVNFMAEHGEYGRAGGFAYQNLPDVERDLAELKQVVEGWNVRQP
jgi:hypothetical protein